ncbi:MAG: hypothetical protein KAI50_13455 [Desulfobacterales bacterium]|nr:hypothetical protein [Desulfobacterales bacterium]
MNYGRRSGVVEAACKNLIGARMKKSGMRWTIDGGQTILTLRSIILSNRWGNFWSYFIEQHFTEFQTQYQAYTLFLGWVSCLNPTYQADLIIIIFKLLLETSG